MTYFCDLGKDDLPMKCKERIRKFRSFLSNSLGSELRKMSMSGKMLGSFKNMAPVFFVGDGVWLPDNEGVQCSVILSCLNVVLFR